MNESKIGGLGSEVKKTGFLNPNTKPAENTSPVFNLRSCSDHTGHVFRGEIFQSRDSSLPSVASGEYSEKRRKLSLVDAPQSKLNASRSIEALHESVSVATYNFMSKKNIPNFCFSPLSLARALSFPAMGASGITKEEFQQLMTGKQASLAEWPIDTLAEGLARCSKEFNQSGLIRTFDYIFTHQNQDFQISQDFKAKIEQINYSEGAKLELQERDNLETEEFKDEINDRVNRDTKGKIKGILNDRLSTRLPGERVHLFIGNAILLKANWQEKLGVTTISFKGSSQLEKTVPAVRFSQNSCSFAKISCGDSIRNWQVAWCPFRSDGYGLLLAMPLAGDHLAAFENDREIFKSAAASLERSESSGKLKFYAVSLPKIKVESTILFRDVFKSSNLINSAFDMKKSDFSRLSDNAGPDSEFAISEIVQKTKFELDEMGVQAASATGLCMRAGGCPPDMLFDHPFKAFIMHKPTSTLLFDTTITEAPEPPEMTWTND